MTKSISPTTADEPPDPHRTEGATYGNQDSVQTTAERLGVKLRETDAEDYFAETKSGGLGPLEVVKLAHDVEQPFMRIRSGPDGGLYRYDDGTYRSDGEEVVRFATNAYLDYLTRNAHINEVVRFFENREGIDPLSFDPPRERAIRAANGILRLSDDPASPVASIEAYGPQNAWLARVPWEYDPDAPEPVKVLGFLRQVLIRWDGEKWVPDTDTINYLLALIGLGMIPRNVLRRAVLLHGKGRNGKSILLHLISHLYGLENVSAVSLEALGSNRFAAAELRGKLANICGDISSNAGADSSVFKQMVGDDRIYGERKFGQPFDFTCGAMPFWSCNVYPRSSDVTPAYIGRWVVIHCPSQFEENAGTEQALKALAEDEAEMQGLLKLAVHHAVRLLSHPKPTTDAVPESMQKAKKRFQQNIDSVRAFVDEALIKDSVARIEGKEAYDWYVQYVEGAGMGRVGRNKFYERLESFESIERDEITTGNKLWFSGIRLDETWTAESGVSTEHPEMWAIPPA